MGSYLKLQNKLEEILGSRNVYYQPPESVKMNYPAVVFGKDLIRPTFSNDGVYLLHDRYSVTVIDRLPDNPIIETIAMLPMCRFDRHYEKDNLNHDVFTLYY